MIGGIGAHIASQARLDFPLAPCRVLRARRFGTVFFRDVFAFPDLAFALGHHAQGGVVFVLQRRFALLVAARGIGALFFAMQAAARYRQLALAMERVALRMGGILVAIPAMRMQSHVETGADSAK